MNLPCPVFSLVGLTIYNVESANLEKCINKEIYQTNKQQQ